MGKDAPTDSGDYDLRSRDLRTHFGAFTKKKLPNDSLCALSLACSRLPPKHIGYMAWLTVVSGTDLFAKPLADWCVGLGDHIHSVKLKRRKRFRMYCESWEPKWGRQACLHGLAVGTFGARQVPGVNVREEQFGVSGKTYQKIRDFVGGCISLGINQYEDEISRAMRLKFHDEFDGVG